MEGSVSGLAHQVIVLKTMTYHKTSSMEKFLDSALTT